MLTRTLSLYRNAYFGLSRRMWLLAVVMLINRSGTMVLPFMTLYCKHIGYSEEQGGIVVAIYGIGAMAGALIGGRISDIFGFYKTQFGALACGGLLFITLGQMETYSSICICTFFLSMVNESFRPANATAIAHYSSPENRTQSFSLVRLAINLGWGVGAGLGGLLASIDYHLLFWVDGITNISAAVMLICILPRVTVEQQRAKKQQHKPLGLASQSPFRDRTFLYFIGLQLLFAICFFQLFTTIPLFFKDGLLLNEFNIGFVMALNGLLIAVFEMVIVFKLEGRRPYLVLMAYGSILMAISFFLLNLPLASGLLVAILATIVVTLAEMIGMPFMNSYYISRTNENNRGQYAGMFTMAWSTAQLIGSSAGTRIGHSIGYNNLWWIIGGISLATAAGFFAMQKYKTSA